MVKAMSNAFWIMLLIGILGLTFQQEAYESGFFKFLKLLIHLYLLGFSAFFVFKSLYLYEIKDSAHVVHLGHKSDHQPMFVIQGVVLCLLLLVYYKIFAELWSFETIIALLLLLYYLSQIFLQGNPSIFISDDRIYYDDYFFESIPWEEVEEIKMENEFLKIEGFEKDILIDLEALDHYAADNILYELDRAVLDGVISSERNSEGLKAYLRQMASKKGVRLKL